MNDDERALRLFPETFRTELAAIQAGARNGGIIAPRRIGGLLAEFEQARKRYDSKIANLRPREPKAAEEAERAIAKYAAEFSAAVSTDNAA
jgi:hypothetical protein